MRKVNFIKGYTRLGMINLPYGGEELNIGVEDGPDAVLTTEFLSRFKDYSIKEFRFPNPEEIIKDDYYKIIAEYSKQLADLIVRIQEKNGGSTVLVGGDHSLGFASVMAQLELYGENVGVIHFDSHDDCCSVESSKTKNFHGMYLRALTDPEFDNEYIKNIPIHLNPENLLIIGNIDCDEDPEGKYLKKQQIKYFEKKDIIADEGAFNEYLKAFVSRFDHIHVSFDIDVFDKSLVAATGTPSANGFVGDDIIAIYNIVRLANNISIDLVEVNPRKSGSKNTIAIAQKVIFGLLQ